MTDPSLSTRVDCMALATAEAKRDSYNKFLVEEFGSGSEQVGTQEAAAVLAGYCDEELADEMGIDEDDDLLPLVRESLKTIAKEG